MYYKVCTHVSKIAQAGSIRSAGRRNACLRRSQHLFKGLGGRSPAERLARPGVERSSHGREITGAVRAQVSPLREVLPQQPIGVLVEPAGPDRLRHSHADRRAQLD